MRLEGWWVVPCFCISKGTWNWVGLTSVGGSWFGFDSKHQCFKLVSDSYRKLLERTQWWGDVWYLGRLKRRGAAMFWISCSSTEDWVEDSRPIWRGQGTKHLCMASAERKGRVCLTSYDEILHDQIRLATWAEINSHLSSTTHRFCVCSDVQSVLQRDDKTLPWGFISRNIYSKSISSQYVAYMLRSEQEYVSQREEMSCVISIAGGWNIAVDDSLWIK